MNADLVLINVRFHTLIVRIDTQRCNDKGWLSHRGGH